MNKPFAVNNLDPEHLILEISGDLLRKDMPLFEMGLDEATEVIKKKI